MLAICSRAYLRKGTLARTFSYKVIGVSRNTQGRSLSAPAAQSLSRSRRRMMGTMKSSQNRERMLFDQLPLVKLIARRIYYRLPKHVLLEDLVQAGMVGLLDAWQKYDCNRRVQFGSYAKVRIRGAILDSLRELDWGPRSLRSFARRVEEARNALRRARGREPSEAEVAAHLAMPLEDFQLRRRDLDQLTTVSFQSDSNGEDHPQDFVDCPTSPPDESPYCIRLRTEVTDLLRTLISKLPDRQRDVLTLYYQQNLTMKEIGTTLGLGESRVSQLHSLAVNGLRERLQDLGHGAHETHVDPVARLLQP